MPLDQIFNLAYVISYDHISKVQPVQTKIGSRLSWSKQVEAGGTDMRKEGLTSV